MGSDTRQSWWWWFCACGVAGALGCGARAPECQGPRCETLDVHVLTWWPGTSNTPATPLREAVELQPGVGEVELNHRASKNSMMAAVESLLLHADGSQRVDTFLANGGRDVLRWTPCGGEGSSERLLQLDGPDGYADLSSRFAPEVLAGVTCCPARSGCAQPGIYALPLGLHRINHIVYNVARFEGCDSNSVKDGPSFVALLDCLGAGGKRVISAPMRNCETHCAESEVACRDCRGVAGESLSYLLESLVLLVSDATSYQSYWRGQSWQSTALDTRAQPLRQALELLESELPRFLNNCPTEAPCAPASAEQALEDVRSGAAAFLVMPDWLMLEAEKEGDGALEGMPFPGTNDTFLFMTDVFTIPVASTPGTSVEAGFRWLDALLDPELQERFADQKHAKAALAGAEQRLLPSLEAQLPASIDPARIRATLNEWLLGVQRGEATAAGLEELMEHEFSEAERQGTLRVAPCDHAPCGKQ